MKNKHDLSFLIALIRMKHLLPLFMIFISIQAFSQEPCNYILKNGLDSTMVYDRDGRALLLYDTVTVPASGPFVIEKNWVLLPDAWTDTSIITHIDYELNPDTVLQAEVEIPLSRLTCIENMDTAAREQFALSVMEEMYRRFYKENEQPGNTGRKTLQEYSAATRSFFYHSFYWAEGYLGQDIIYTKDAVSLWEHYLYVLSNDVWGNPDEGAARIALLFAARPELFGQAFNLVGREQNRSYMTAAIRRHFRKYLYEPPLRFDNSGPNRLFREYHDKAPGERAILVLAFYEPYLQELGFTKDDMQTLLK